MEKKDRSFRKFAHWQLTVTLAVVLVVSWIFFLSWETEKETKNKKPETTSKKISTPISSESLSLNARYICPEDMVVLPSHTTDRVWIVKPNGKHERIKGKERKIKAFCMDRFEYPNRKNKLPKTRVSYMEAMELCRKSDKRLCTEFEWDFACSGEENWPYAYGPEKEKFRCNTDDVLTGACEWIAPSGSHPGCRNRYGVYDLNGNVSEWVAMREHVNKGIVRGGTAWYSKEYGQSCFSRHMHLVNDDTWPDDGFRCCKDAVPRNVDEMDRL